MPIRLSRPVRGSGQAMVETAFAFPLLVLMAVGLVQFALFFQAHNVVEAAVQDGARWGASTQGTVDEARLAAEKRATQVLSMGPGNLAKVTPDVNGTTQDVVVVKVTAQMDTVIPWFDPAQGGLTHLKVPLDATGRAVRERFRSTPLTPPSS